MNTKRWVVLLGLLAVGSCLNTILSDPLHNYIRKCPPVSLEVVLELPLEELEYPLITGFLGSERLVYVPGKDGVLANHYLTYDGFEPEEALRLLEAREAELAALMRDEKAEP